MQDNDEYLSELKSIKEELKALRVCLIEYINSNIKNSNSKEERSSFDKFSENRGSDSNFMDYTNYENYDLENHSLEFESSTSNEFPTPGENSENELNHTNHNQNTKYKEVSEMELMDVLFEPLSNKRRLLILKALLMSNRTYSELSIITGIRGGNLLFHLRKLQNSKLVSQNRERKDYYLTHKGKTILNLIYQVYYIISEK
ncbi:winged helix-turn-helix domain-containing protein [Methanococcus voltae]|uniref:Transcriptional regulator, ArsR family n=1 Tax=Methanococcus voltae (strain ATCC BAA-1334 / A3) TaxID=456320 RepID=D7DSC4_METV3|nr:winged helix-turn-helix domain-containing protein [Methanococcus voltae]MCS3901560.1 DNA-binding transcriptional ArsR family regulator [Methanococcus voltae]